MDALTPLTLAVLREHRTRGLWCTADDTGPFGLVVIDASGSEILVQCSFVPESDIKFMVSYRWRQMCTVPENRSHIAVNFLNITKGRGCCWVDSLNHLNDENLKGQVLEHMGGLYRRKKTIAEYFEYGPPKCVRDVFRTLAEATRGWMWQEIALGNGVERFGSTAAQLCFQLLKLGKDRFYEVKELRNRKDIKNKQERTKVECIAAMADALEQCADWGPRVGEYVANQDDEFWTNLRQTTRADEGYDCLLSVPSDAAVLVAKLSAQRSDTERGLMSAAGNLANRNIGDSRTMTKPDIVDASLGVVAAGPEYAGSKREREGQVLDAMRGLLVHACGARTQLVTFFPVPCDDSRVRDLFQTGIDAFCFVGGVHEERGEGEFVGRATVEIRRNGSYAGEQYPCEVWEYHGSVAPLSADAEHDVVSIHFALTLAVSLDAVDVSVPLLIAQQGFCVHFSGANKPLLKVPFSRPQHQHDLPNPLDLSPSPADGCSCCVL